MAFCYRVWAGSPWPFQLLSSPSLWWLSFAFGDHRWSQAADDLQIVYENLTGDVLVSAGVIAYLGAFTSGFRQKCTEDWSRLCKVVVSCFKSFFLKHPKYVWVFWGNDGNKDREGKKELKMRSLSFMLLVWSVILSQSNFQFSFFLFLRVIK